MTTTEAVAAFESSSIELALERVRGRKEDLNSFHQCVEAYVQWHKDNPTLAKPRVMIIHEEEDEEDEV